MIHQAKHLLQQTFGYHNFRFNQKAIIETLLNGQDAFVLMPTGGGKSLCYQIPALVRSGVGIVVSPLIALMQDQVSALTQLGIKAAFLNSTLSYQDSIQIQQQLRNQSLDLLYIAPERLLKPSTLEFLKQCEIALFAIDEAHCVSQWGHDFRPEYQQLYLLHQHFPHIPRIALTATADQRTRQEIIQQLDLSQATEYTNSFDRPNIFYQISEAQNARQQLWRFLQENHAQDAGIIYCLSRKKVEATAEWFSQQGRVALPYHAQIPAQQRMQNQQRFLQEEGVIIVATVAFGMGIDKPNVRFVAHLNLPKNIESYYQETGRAGRDGEPANAWMAYGLQDIVMLRKMMMDSEAHAQYKRVSQSKLEAMLGFCELVSCRRQALLAYFDETLEQPCGHCDNCLNPPKTWDALVSAQKALSCVYRTGQRFGAGYVIEVLLGQDKDPRIKKNKHHQVSTWNIGQEHNATAWRSIYRQLLSQGFLATDQEGFGILLLTEKSRLILRGEIDLQLRELPKKAKKSSTVAARNTQQVYSWQDDLYQALRQLRMTLAKQQQIPPYHIFQDATLIEMVHSQPKDQSQLQAISGVGEKKGQQYGSAFLDCIQQHRISDQLNNTLSETVNTTFAAFLKNQSPKQIAYQRQLKINTILGHLANAIAADLLDVKEVISLPKVEYNEIVAMIKKLDTCKTKAIKPLFDAFKEAYDYGTLKCIVASECHLVFR